MYFFKKEKKAIYRIRIRSVSADMKNCISVFYRIGQFEKWNLSVHIGIGQKKLIGRTLCHSKKDGLEKVGLFMA